MKNFQKIMKLSNNDTIIITYVPKRVWIFKYYVSEKIIICTEK